MTEILFLFDGCLHMCAVDKPVGPANSSKMVTAADFKFGTHVSMDSVDTTP